MLSINQASLTTGMPLSLQKISIDIHICRLQNESKVINYLIFTTAAVKKYIRLYANIASASLYEPPRSLSAGEETKQVTPAKVVTSSVKQQAAVFGSLHFHD